MEPNTTLEARVRRLERNQRRWRAGAIALAMLMGAGVLLGLAQPRARVLTTTRLELVDSEGRLRGVLTTAEDGSPGLMMLDDAGATRLTLAAQAGGPVGLLAHGVDGAVGLSATLEGEGRGVVSAAGVRAQRLALHDGEDRDRIQMGMLEQDEPGIVIGDEAGTPRVRLFAIEGGGPGLNLCDPGGLPRVQMAVRDGGESGLLLRGSDAARRVMLVTRPDDAPVLGLLNELGEIVFGAPQGAFGGVWRTPDPNAEK